MPGRKVRGVESFAELIVKRRAALELSQAALAKKVQTGPDFVSLVESGKRKPALETLPRWAEALSLDLGELALAWIAADSPEVAASLMTRRGRKTYDLIPDVRRLQALNRLPDDVRAALDLILDRLTR